VPLVALYDACVLYPASLRDFLLRLANTGILRARYTEEILDECFRSIQANRPDLKPEVLARTRNLMREAVPDCIVNGFDCLMDGFQLPDADDHHVLAAAIHAGAQVIVTLNLKDFPPAALAEFHIKAMHPDDFVLDAIDLSPGSVVKVVSEQAKSLKNPPKTIPELLDTLRDQGLVQSVAKLRSLLGS
jgi:hypothetical protein